MIPTVLNLTFHICHIYLKEANWHSFNSLLEISLAESTSLLDVFFSFHIIAKCSITTRQVTLSPISNSNFELPFWVFLFWSKIDFLKGTQKTPTLKEKLSMYILEKAQHLKVKQCIELAKFS